VLYMATARLPSQSSLNDQRARAPRDPATPRPAILAYRAHDLTVDWCWPNLANTWICLVLDWANTWISGLLSIPLRRAPQAVFILLKFIHNLAVRT
jgi:hypothetical protein